MGTFLLQFLLGCRHRSQSRLFTLDNQTYKVCLDCGKVIHYSLERMAPLSIREQRQLRRKERVLSGRS
jgi:RNA polymerase-binding transcription factor DksA